MESQAAAYPQPDQPGEGLSIARAGDEASTLRHRIELPARLGRVILTFFGVVTGFAGVATWATTKSVDGIALGAFGTVLIVLGVVQHLLYLRDRAHWPERAFLWDDGLELVLHNGEVRGASWSDPDFGLQLIARRARPPIGREFVMVWLMDSKVPPVELSPEGFDQLRQSAADHDLDLTQTRRGSRADSTQFIHVHPSSAATAAARAKAMETTGPG